MRARIAGLVYLTFNLGCLGDVEVPPAPPTLNPVQSPTAVSTQVLQGAKPAGTAVLSQGEIVVPHDDEESWQFELALVPGDNMVVLTTQRESGLDSQEHVEALIVYEPPCPQSPVLAPVSPLTRNRTARLQGTKSPGTLLLLNEGLIVSADVSEWSYDWPLPDADGEHVANLVAVDAKNRRSDPVTVTVTLDRRAPILTHRYPLDGETEVPTNVVVGVAFDGALEVSGIEPPVDTLIVEANGTRVPGILIYHVVSRSLSWLPSTGELSSGVEHTVTVDPAFIADAAGNQATAADAAGWRWAFTTGAGPDLTPPPAATLEPLAEIVETSSITLRGTKGAFTSIYVNGQQAVPVTADTGWTFGLPLAVGTTSVSVSSRSVTDVADILPASRVERRIERPAPPVLDASVPVEVTSPSVPLTGTRPANTSVLLDGLPIACRDVDPTWAFAAPLSPGVNELRLTSKNDQGIESDPILHTVRYAQAYDGPVPSDFVLRVEFNLRDLNQIPEIRQEFVTGSNNYGIDAWVEGPLELGETCQMQDGQRQNIRYVATIQHYIGTKAQHKVPFADEDYRGADYLAGLISGGVFSFLGLSPGAERREANGKEKAGILASVTETDLRQNIDCFGSPIVDACTRPTVNAERITLVPWTPRQRNGQGLLEQGDYLLFIQINLDRDGSWLSANDFETCWGSPVDRNRGMHRVVTPISLGASPYTLVVPQSEELFGPDREGSERLHFISQEGVTIIWGPNQ